MTGLIAIGASLAIGLGALGAALGMGKTGAAAIESMARQPAEGGKLRTAMILAFAFMESLAIYCLLISFMLLGKMPSV